jgi:hypothetical protein
MKKTLLYSLLFLLSSICIVGCLPEDTNVYDGPNVAEFKNHTLGMVSAALTARGVTSVSQTDSSRTISLNSGLSDTVKVQLVGLQSAVATELDFSLRTSGLNMAVEGTHFAFDPASSRKVTIPANSSVGYILIKPTANSLTTVGETRVIRLDLIGGAAVKANPNYDSFIITLRR